MLFMLDLLLLEEHSKDNLQLWTNQSRNLNVPQAGNFCKHFLFYLFLLFPHTVLQKRVLVARLQQINCAQNKC